MGFVFTRHNAVLDIPVSNDKNTLDKGIVDGNELLFLHIVARVVVAKW